MLNEALSMRYATAIYEMASEKQQAPEVLKGLQLITATVNGHAELREAMTSPTLGYGVKQQISEKLFSTEVCALALHFYSLLLKKRREAYLDDIIELFIGLYQKDRDILAVKLEVATKIDVQIEELVRTNMQKKTGKKVELDVEVRPDLVAGAVIHTGETYYDGSLKNQLAEMYKKLKQG